MGASVGGGIVSVGMGAGVEVEGSGVIVGVMVWVAVSSGVKVLVGRLVVTMGKKVSVGVFSIIGGGMAVQVARPVGGMARVGTSNRMAVGGAVPQAAKTRKIDREILLIFTLLESFLL